MLRGGNRDANPQLTRVALKLATGAGKTTVMAMLRDRLRVLQSNDPDSYESRELVPGDMMADLGRAKIVITTYHAFKLRERLELI